ncbi:MAG: hypothetical protein LAO76_27405 [Acidobacteriia bacterium]|nr:hypothetical protein [Terriglobia bacterium]
MSVPADVSLEGVRAELMAAAQYAAAAGLEFDAGDLREDNLRLYVEFKNQNSERFYAEFLCLEYPLHPPTIEFVSEDRRERGTHRLYPNGFHTTPCVCMRYNRKAYSERGGPHADWRLLDWRLPTSHGVAIDTLALMISDLHSKILQSSGRMA